MNLVEGDDLVLRSLLSTVLISEGKFALDCDGPYIVKKVLPRGALILIEMGMRNTLSHSCYTREEMTRKVNKKTREAFLSFHSSKSITTAHWGGKVKPN